MDKDENIYLIKNNKGKLEKINYKGQTYIIRANEGYAQVLAKIASDHKDFYQNAKNGYAIITEEELRKMELDQTNKIIEEAKNNNVKNLKIYDNNASKTKKPWSLKKKVGALVTAAVILFSTGIGLAACKKQESKSIETLNNNNELTLEEIKSMSFEQLLAYLSEGNQKETFKLLDQVQNYFNNTAAPSIKKVEDQDNQLYLNADEIIALHVMANSDTYTEETLAKIYGPLLKAGDISNNYIQAARIMWSYYSRATQPSGIAKLFEDKENQKLVTTFENLIISYNKADDYKTKQKIGQELVSFYQELVDTSKLDNAKKENPEAVSYILTVGLPFSYSNGMIDEEIYQFLIRENETITCDVLYSQVQAAEKVANSKNYINDSILNELPRALDDKNILVTARDINTSYWVTNGDNNYISNYGSNFKEEFNKVTSSTEVSKDEAKDKFGEDQVNQGENDADNKVEEENEQANQDAKDYQTGYNAGYEIAYKEAASTGVFVIITDSSKSASYNKGFVLGQQNGGEAGLIEYQAKIEAEKNNENNNGTVEEKPLPPETPSAGETSETEQENNQTSSEPVITEKPLQPELPGEGEIATDENGNTLQNQNILQVTSEVTPTEIANAAVEVATAGLARVRN